MSRMKKLPSKLTFNRNFELYFVNFFFLFALNFHFFNSFALSLLLTFLIHLYIYTCKDIYCNFLTRLKHLILFFDITFDWMVFGERWRVKDEEWKVKRSTIEFTFSLVQFSLAFFPVISPWMANFSDSDCRYRMMRLREIHF